MSPGSRPPVFLPAAPGSFLESQVYHARTETARNSFRYPVLNLFVAPEGLAELNRFFRRRFFGLMSVNAGDYLAGDRSVDLGGSVRSFVRENFGYNAGQIRLQTMPRMAGYVFNPVSFWYFFRESEKQSHALEAVLCEVNNTFGERHFYWLYQGGADLNGQWLESKKEFHVSPFFQVDGRYRFRFFCSADRIEAHIQLLSDDGELKLNTWVKGHFRDLRELSLLRVALKYGWMTPLVVLRIHYQALKLFLKRVRFYSKPERPESDVTR